MWIFTNFGFFSIVQKPEDVDENMLTVRSRTREDIENFVAEFSHPVKIIIDNHADYLYRVRAKKEDVQNILFKSVGDIHYNNFKNEVAKSQGVRRAHKYHKVWDVMYKIQLDEMQTKIW